MNKISNKVVGIDLGTTNSCVAIMEGGKAKIIQNENGENTTPSVVLFDEKGEKEAVGESAKSRASLEPKRVIFEAKRLIGRKFSPTEEKEKEEIEKFRQIAPFKIIPSKNGDAWVEVENKKYSPEQISAFILQEMKLIAENYLGETVNKAVITVPAYFGDAQREATKVAGKIAGLEVLRVINEPTAAAFAYGIDKKDHTVAVFDLGGGTFDISIVEINKGVFEVKATNGDTFLGGANFDQKIVEWLLKEFEEEHKINLRKDETALQKLKTKAEKAKQELSKLSSVDIIETFIYTDASGPKHINKKLSRQRLNDLTADLLEKLVLPCEKCLKDAKANGANKIDEVILVGGMTRMPSVREKVKEIFGKEPNKSVNADEAVAAGAAIQGAILSGESKEGILLLDVTPLSLGIETLGGVFTRLINRNTTIPTGKKQIFSTAEDNQDKVTIRIFQGEREMANDNKFLGQGELAGIKPARKGVPQIEVNFDIDSDGIFKVTARDLNNPNNKIDIEVQKPGGLSKEEVEEMVRKAEASAEEDQKKRKDVENLNQTRDHLYNFGKQVKEFEKLKDEPQFQEFQKLYENLKEAVDKGDKGDFSQIEEVLGKVAEMNKIAEELKKKMPKEDEKKDEGDKSKK